MLIKDNFCYIMYIHVCRKTCSDPLSELPQLGDLDMRSQYMFKCEKKRKKKRKESAPDKKE